MIALMVIGVSSCTKDEVNEISQAEKELLVKQTLIEFNKSAVKTGKYEKFVNVMSLKNSSNELNEEEIEALVQEFLGSQTQMFLDLFYKLESLNLTDEEFFHIANQLESLFINVSTGEGKQATCCEEVINTGSDGLDRILTWYCCIGSGDTTSEEDDSNNGG